ncbi:hypothetical protein PIROE2DRAFT_2626 [Piromyces sp. E2]|nr:hypothetical protein PIROE2DRAFT_2626 [Piromyces sp. E2]|eukprot:OUM69533.1 hypothetical protein PIROE2DRAFT_2626 [Piromyces sp. E2]
MDPVISISRTKEEDSLLFTASEYELLMHKLEFIMLVFSTTCYFYFVTRSISRIRTAFFALMNNISASLNWIPISWYQVVRLYYITYNYYMKSVRRMIFILSVTFSLVYSLYYLLNLNEFYGNKDSFGGCTVSNTNKYGNYVEIFDIIDSCFSLIIVITTLFQSIRHLKQYKLRHHKIKAILDESISAFVILLVSKVIFYTLIIINSGKPGGDIYWDVLSVIVLYCTYRLLNITPKLNLTTIYI